MLKLYTPARGESIIKKYDPVIRKISGKYGLPPAVIKAVLYTEMIRIDLLDIAADLAVRMGAFFKRDSSTGYAQIYGYVAINAANFAADRGIASYASLGLGRRRRRLNPKNPADVRKVWLKIHRDPAANMEFAVLNLLSCAEEMTGRIDFEGYTPEELKLILSRYNGNVKWITSYGEEAYGHYQRYLSRRPKKITLYNTNTNPRRKQNG